MAPGRRKNLRATRFTSPAAPSAPAPPSAPTGSSTAPRPAATGQQQPFGGRLGGTGRPFGGRLGGGGPGYGGRLERQFPADEWEWITPSSSVWPDVLPDGTMGRPPGPRTQAVGYNAETGVVRVIFRPPSRKVNGVSVTVGRPARYEYPEVTPAEWEQLKDTASTGRFINSTLNAKPYRRTNFPNPPGGLPADPYSAR